MVSAEPYASYLHFAPEDNHASTSSVGFLRARMPILTPNQQRQSTEGQYTTVHVAKQIIENYNTF